MNKGKHGNRRIPVYQGYVERFGKLEKGREGRMVREGVGLDVYYMRITCLFFMVSMSVSTRKGSEKCAT